MDPKPAQDAGDGVLYEPDERSPVLLSAFLGLQLCASPLVAATLFPTIVFRGGGAGEPVVLWAVFASLVLCGLTTMAQASRRGAGYILQSIAASATIAVGIAAVAAGGPGLLALLLVVSTVFQFVLAARLSLFRRILTPAIAGTVLMLLPVSVMPVVLRDLERVPDGVSPAIAGIVALVTISVIGAIGLRGGAAIRLWAPIIGVGAGVLCAAPFGLYDLERVADAPWVGLPGPHPPALDLDFGPAFWALLPAFLFVTLIVTSQTLSATVAIQQVSWRRPRALNYRSVQRAIATAGLGNLFCAFAGTMPNASFSSSAPVAQMTGVAARRVGVAAGA